MTNTIIKRFLLSLFLSFSCVVSAAESDDGWVTMFNGKNLDGWKISENPQSWKVENGAIIANGPRSHLFYVGDSRPFTNFIFRAQVMTRENSNGGIYFHTRFQETGWPKYGFEAQINNTFRKDHRKTASLYQVRDITDAPAKDNEWFDYEITVQGKRIVIKINDRVLVDYTEPEGAKPGSDFTRVIDQGTFALQAHDAGSTVLHRNLRVKRLP
jgi:hypothetical protein